MRALSPGSPPLVIGLLTYSEQRLLVSSHRPHPSSRPAHRKFPQSWQLGGRFRIGESPALRVGRARFPIIAGPGLICLWLFRIPRLTFASPALHFALSAIQTAPLVLRALPTVVGGSSLLVYPEAAMVLDMPYIYSNGHVPKL